jgi:diaminopimelate epimerase
MSALTGRPFFKMNGLGNEIIVLDLRGTSIRVTPEDARAIHAQARLAYDQLMVLHDPVSAGTEAFVRILNNDGSESGACGNGTRCVAWVLMQNDPREIICVETVRGKLECRRNSEWSFTVDMGEPLLEAAQIPLAIKNIDTGHVTLDFDVPGLTEFAAVNMGNPHAVFFVDNVDAYALEANGVRLEHHPMFPERANISLVHVVSRDHVILKVWERGVGLTQACGSAACATAVAAARLGKTGRAVRITLPGGDLLIDWRERDNHVLMCGPVELEFRDVFSPEIF